MTRATRARLGTAITATATALAVVPVASILVLLIVRGAAGLADAFPALGPALGGSSLLLAIACGGGVPIGLGAGLFLHERRGTRAAAALRYVCDVLVGVPSVVFGIVAWLLLVRPAGHFSAWAGGTALGAIIVPLVARTADDVLALVPPALGEAALALGFSRWRATGSVVLRAALPGVMTGVLAAAARVAGETAPLLFTAFGNQHASTDPGAPVAALPLAIYTDALSAAPAARSQAYAGGLLLVAAVAILGLAARAAAARIAGGTRRVPTVATLERAAVRP